MATENFVDPFQTTLLNHWQRTSRPLFCWLEQQSYCFIRGQFGYVLLQNLCRHQKHGCVTVMPTHVREISGGAIFQVRIVFWHGKRVDVCPQCNRPFFTTCFSLSLQINYQASLRGSTHLLCFHTEGK